MGTPFSKRVLIALLLSLAWGTHASAQESAPLIRGDRLRLSPESLTPFQGMLESTSIEGLTLVDDHGQSAYVPYAMLLKLEKAAGRNRRRGALIGGTVGFFVGAVVAVATSECADCDDPYGIGDEGLIGAASAGTGAILGGILFGGLGAIVGGVFAAPERWIEVSFYP